MATSVAEQVSDDADIRFHFCGRIVCSAAQVLEVFGSGTAAIVSPVKAIFYNNEVLRRTQQLPDVVYCCVLIRQWCTCVRSANAGAANPAGPQEPV